MVVSPGGHIFAAGLSAASFFNSGDVLEVIPNGSVAFNGSTGYAEAASSPDLNLTSDWTVETWFKDEDPRGFNHEFRQLLAKGDGRLAPDVPYFIEVGRNRIEAGVQTDGRAHSISFDLAGGHDDGGDNQGNQDDHGVLRRVDPALWHHVAVSLHTVRNEADEDDAVRTQLRADKAAGDDQPDSDVRKVLRLYLDGKLGAHHRRANRSHGRQRTAAGHRTRWTGERKIVAWQAGRCTDLERCQKRDYIRANFESELIGPQAGLVANWHFDDAIGTTAADSAGNHPATLHGGAKFSTDVHP